MARQYINWKLVIILIVAGGVLGTAAFTLHGWQKSIGAERSLHLGDQAYAEGRWEQAADQFGTYLSVHANDSTVLMKYADAHLRIRPLKQNNLAHALEAYSAVLRLDKSNGDATNRIVRLCLRPDLRQWKEANDHITTYLGIKKDDPTLRRFRGIALIGQRKFADAANVLAQLIKDHPDEVPAYEIIGQLAEKRKEDVNLPAVNWADEAVKQNPTSALAYAIRASSRRLKGRDPNAAIADLDKALTLDLSDTIVHVRVANELLNVGALDKAKENLDRLLAKLPKDEMVWQDFVERPKNIIVWEYLAKWAQLSGSKENMQKIARAGLEDLAGQPGDFLFTAAQLYIGADQLQEADSCIARMREKAVSPPEVAFLQGLLYRSRGQLSKAAASWEDAVALGYHDLPTLRIDLADVLAQMDDLQSAAEQLRTLINEFPDQVEARLVLVKILVQSRDWAGVLEQCGLIRQYDPGNGGAALMEVQARIQMLAATSESMANDAAWRAIELRLRQLDEAAKGDARMNVKLLRAQAAMLQSKFSEASSLVDELQKSGYPELSVNLLRARLWVVQKKEPEAAALLRETIKKFPEEVEPVRDMVILLRQSGKQQECESLVKDRMAGAKEASTRRRFGLLLADLYASWRQADQTQTVLSDLAEQDPNDMVVRRWLLTLDNVARNIPEAQKIVDQIKKIDEKSWQWRYEQAKVWFQSQDFETHYTEIVQLLKANLQAQPTSQINRLLLGMAHEKHGDLQLAIAAYQEVLDHAPDDINVIVRIVTALNKAKNAAKAEEILARVGDRKASNPILQRLEFESRSQLGEWDSASKVLEQLAVGDPCDVSVNLTLASLFVQQKRYDEAQVILDRLRTKASQSIGFADVQTRLYVGKGDGEAALKMCDDAIGNHDDASGYRLRARVHSLLNQPVKAIDDIQKALAKDANDLPTVQLAASLFINSGSRTLIDRARDLLDRASASHPADLDLKYFRARLLILKNTAPANAEARQLLKDATNGRPRFPEAWEQLGWMELREGQPGRAVDVALDGLRSNPRDKRLLLLKAQGEAGRSSPVQAVPTLTALAEQDPNDAEVALFLADVYIRSDMVDKAVELLQQRIARAGAADHRKYQTALAAALYQGGQTDNGVKQFVALMQAEPNDPSPVVTFARLLIKYKRWTELQQLTTDWTSSHPRDLFVATTVAEWLSQSQGGPEAKDLAESLLRSVLQRDPKNNYALYLLAVLYQSYGQNSEAIKLNRQALEIDPNNVIVMNNLAWLLCEDQKQYDEALKLAGKGYKIAPEYCDLIDTLGVVYYRMGNYKEAVDSLTDCIKKCPLGRPLVVQSRFHLGRAYAKMGHKTEAIKELSETLKAQEALDQQSRPGGLSPAEQGEARSMLDQLQRGNT